jgi:hypothetical protein
MIIRRKYDGFYYLVYKTTCLVNNKIYVGYHKTQKLNDGYIGSGTSFENSVRLYGKENFRREILEFCISLKHMDIQERYWVKELHANDKKIGYNITDGGGGGDTITNHPDKKIILKKWKKSEEFKDWLSEKMTGRSLSEEHKANIGKGLKGKTKGKIVLQESRDKISKKLIDHKDSPEICKKKSDGHKGKPTWNKGLTKETDERVGTQGKKGQIVWNKGLTKETDERVKKGGEKQQGKIVSEKTKQILREKNQGKRQSEETKRIKRDSYLQRPIETCQYCGYESRNGSAMKCYHGDNCKHNPNKNIETTKTKIA